MLSELAIQRVLDKIAYKDWEFHLGADSLHGELVSFYLQVVFTDPKTQTILHGRKWRLSKHMTKGEVAQTALMAVLAAEEHEVREHFTYKGAKVFGPHQNIDKLVQLCQTSKPMKRKPK